MQIVSPQQALDKLSLRSKLLKAMEQEEEEAAAAMSSRINSASWNQGTGMSIMGSLRYAIREVSRSSIFFYRLIELLVLNTSLLLRFRYLHEDELINLFVPWLLHFNICYMYYEVPLLFHDLYVTRNLVEDDQDSSPLVESGLGDLVGKYLIVIIAISLASPANVLLAAYAILLANVVKDRLYMDSDDLCPYIGKICEVCTALFVHNGIGRVTVTNSIASINTYIESFKSRVVHRIREVEETWPLGVFSYLVLHLLSVFLYSAFQNWLLLLLPLMVEIGCSDLGSLVMEKLDVEAIIDAFTYGVRKREAAGSSSNIARMLEDLENALERVSRDNGKQYVDHADDDGELEVKESSSRPVQPTATTEIDQSVSPSTSGGELADMENSVQSVVESSSGEESEEIESTNSSVWSVDASVSNEESERTCSNEESERTCLIEADRDWIVLEEDEDHLEN